MGETLHDRHDPRRHNHLAVVHRLVGLDLHEREPPTIGADPGDNSFRHLNEHAAQSKPARLVVCRVDGGPCRTRELVRRQTAQWRQFAYLRSRELRDILRGKRPRAPAALHDYARAGSLERHRVGGRRFQHRQQPVSRHEERLAHFAYGYVDA